MSTTYMGMSAAHCQGNVREFKFLESGHPELVYMSTAMKNDMYFVLVSLLLWGSILRKYSLEMSGKVREFDNDWRVATLQIIII